MFRYLVAQSPLIFTKNKAEQQNLYLWCGNLSIHTYSYIRYLHCTPKCRFGEVELFVTECFCRIVFFYINISWRNCFLINVSWRNCFLINISWRNCFLINITWRNWFLINISWRNWFLINISWRNCFLINISWRNSFLINISWPNCFLINISWPNCFLGKSCGRAVM